MIAFAREYRQLRSRGRNNRFLKLLPRIQSHAALRISLFEDK